MEDFSIKEYSNGEKLVLLLTFGFDEVLRNFVDQRMSFVKVDIAIVDKDGSIAYSYNNGNEINYYQINDDKEPCFCYAPNQSNPPRFFQSCINSTMPPKTIHKQIKLFYKRWEKETKEEYPRDVLSPSENITRTDDVYIFATLIGYSNSWQYLKILQYLFKEYLNVLKGKNVFDIKRLHLLSKFKKAIPVVDAHAIMRKACERELRSRFSSSSQYRRTDNSSFYDIICNLSTLPYENNPNKGTIGFIKKLKSVQGQHLLFDNPIPFEMQALRELRKLLEMSSSNMALIVKDRQVVGIASKSSFRSKITFGGNGQWKLSSNNIIVLSTSGNICHITPSAESVDLFACYTECFGKDKGRDFVDTIVSVAKKQKHGTAIVICSNAKDEAKRLCDLNRGIAIEPAELKDEQLTQAITSIDGALLLDENGICYAIGVILDGDAVLPGSTARGARYNSLCNYIERQVEKTNTLGMAIILSEDHTIDIYPDENRCKVLKNQIEKSFHQNSA